MKIYNNEQITSKRRELKYYINYNDFINLTSRISHLFSMDKNSGNDGWYRVRSLYFDNKTNDNYYEKISGIELRKKYRMRVYNLNSDPIKLEIKNKINDVIVKESVSIGINDMEKIISGDYSCLLNYNNSTARKIYCDFTKDYYKPVIIIDYKRKAYFIDINNIRITFDSGVKKNEINLNKLFAEGMDMAPVFNHNKIIMEIKYNGSIPDWIKKLLHLSRFERCAISKYTLSRYLEG